MNETTNKSVKWIIAQVWIDIVNGQVLQKDNFVAIPE